MEKGNEQGLERHSSDSVRKTITFFNSFEEARNFRRQQMADRTPQERLQFLEQIRKYFLKEHLLPNGEWPPLQLVITIKKGVLK